MRLLEPVGPDQIAAAVREKFLIQLAPQLIDVPEPFTSFGQRDVTLRMTLPDGSKPILVVQLIGQTVDV